MCSSKKDARTGDLLDRFLLRRSLTSGPERVVTRTNGPAAEGHRYLSLHGRRGLDAPARAAARTLWQRAHRAPASPARGVRGSRRRGSRHAGRRVLLRLLTRARCRGRGRRRSRALASHDWPEGAELRVRMGMHSGEPVLSDEGRYHGMGVHRTARIMAAGHGGQILASQATASVLADDDLEGISLRDLGEHSLKDLPRPERIYEVQVEGLERDFAPLKTEGAAQAPTPLHRRPVAIGALGGVVAAAIAIPVFAFGGGSGGSSLSALSGNSVGIVNAATGAIDGEVSDVPTPTRVASGDDAIWVTSADTNSVYRIDANSHELRDTIRVGDGPSGIAFGGGDIWVANILAGTVSRIDPDSVDVETFDVGAAGRGVAVGGGAVWIGDSAENRVVRVDAKTNAVTQTIGVGSGPSALAFGAGALWVANTLDGTVSRIDPESGQVRATVPVGANPSAIAASGDAVWVANEAGRTIVRLDPQSGNVAQTVRTGARPTGLTIAGSLWVTGQAAAGAHRGGTLRFVASLDG